MKLILTFLVLKSLMLCNSLRSRDHTTRKRMCPDPPLPQHMIRHQTVLYEEAVEHDGMLYSGERLMFYSGDTLVYRCQDGFSVRKNGPCLNHYPYLKSDHEHDPAPNPYHCTKPDPNPNPDHYPNPDPNPDPYPNPYYNNEESDESISSTLVCDDSGRWNGRTLYTIKFEECIPVLCDAECKKNDGTCIAPGKCGMCPKGKYGNNCEHRECKLSTDGPKVKTEKLSYQIGDKISSSDFVCAVGQIATPETGITCLEWGNWSETAKCISGCKPPVGMPVVKNNSKTFYNEGDKISSSSLFCPGGLVLFPKDDKICLNGGIWTDTAKCQKPCEINFVQGQVVSNEDNISISTHGVQRTFQDGTKLHIKCAPGYSLTMDNETLENTNVSQVTSVCQTGSWKPVYQCFQDCQLSDKDSLLYKTVDGDDVNPGSFIKHGTRLQVYCLYIDLGDYTYTYDSEDDKDVPLVECSNGTIGQFNITCKQGDPATCTTLDNGYVERRFLNEYKVSCNEGYALNLMRPDLPYCECQGDKLVCQYGGQTPKCEPELCTIPYSYDDRLSIFIRRGGSVVSLSGVVTVNVGETLFFNCINTEFENIEPNNRRFKCKTGKWLEDEKDKEWKLGNNGEFPLCRNTSCVPMCKNGGKCIRDGECQCPHLTSGATCEDVLCDAECKKNGGTCIAPGKCGMCPKGKYGNNCEHRECTLATDGPKVKKEKSSYQIGDKISSSDFVCAVGQISTPETGITCLEWGNWSETAKCISMRNN